VFGKLRVAREQQQSAGVLIQPAHGHNPASGILNEIVNGRPPVGIPEGGDVAGGLVEQQVDFLARFDGLVVQGDFVAPEIHPVIGSLDQLAIYFDSSCADPLARFGARSQARFRQHALQCFERALARGL